MPRNNRHLQNSTVEFNPHRAIATGASRIQPQPSSESSSETTSQPAAKPNPRFLSLLLQALIMALVFSLFFVFVGVATIIFMHLCIAGGALHRRRQQRRSISRDGDSSSGYSPDELKTLPKSRFRGSEICAICLDNLSEGEICRVLPDCKHIFHLNCVDQWLSKVPACPVCRRSLRLTDSEAKRTAVIDWEQLWAACGQ